MERWPLLEVESNDEVITVIWLVDSSITLGSSKEETGGSICLTILYSFPCVYKKGGSLEHPRHFYKGVPPDIGLLSDDLFSKVPVSK